MNRTRRMKEENKSRLDIATGILPLLGYFLLLYFFEPGLGNGAKKYCGGTSSIMQMLKNNSNERCWF